MFTPILVIGAGQAAAQAVETLRKKGHVGPLTVVGDEALLPYQRPPLSKKYLSGAMEKDRLLFRHADHYAQHAVDLHLGFAVSNLDATAHRVEVTDGSHFEYEKLLLATGSRPRLLPVMGSELAGVYYLRTVADVDRLRAEMRPGRRAVIIGGGYIGLEVASTCREAGLEVTVVEAADRVMSRVVSPVVSRFYEAEHARHGVEILLGARLGELVSADPPGAGNRRVSAVRLVDGRELPADFVLVAIGVVPGDALALAAGLACEDGILVDQFCRTSDASIWAAGDCTRQRNLHFGLSVRLESVDNAFEQGTSAALNMLGLTTVHDKVPWFWSDQFDLKMVIVGLSAGHDRVVVRGNPAARAFSVCYLKSGELIAVETINHIKDQMGARKLIPARARPDLAKLADDTIALKDTL
ncbi:MAG TPA: FAD-dependent oxidoreductase [Steroidobacteraceae bacterium]|jgi:3-phenylpropionate/trans-cinnamate dioxygenase ferredoxin reductase subunit|nr:FAD-dependent oxidoreductase [Steroidobacteraceae bacterium]